MTVELLYFDGCPGAEALFPRLRELLAEAGAPDSLTARRIQSPEQAERERFLGSPTVRIDGRDIEAGAETRTDYGMKCRLYRSDGDASGRPPEEWILTALRAAGARVTACDA